MTHYRGIVAIRSPLETEIMMTMPNSTALRTTKEPGGTKIAIIQT